MEHIENQIAATFRKKAVPLVSRDIEIVRKHADVARDSAIRAGRTDAARSLERCIAILARMIEIETEHEEKNDVAS